jgi:hypothetical protein
MWWVIRLEKKIFLTVAGQRRIFTDFPQSHSLTFNIKLLAYLAATGEVKQLTTPIA